MIASGNVVTGYRQMEDIISQKILESIMTKMQAYPEFHGLVSMIEETKNKILLRSTTIFGISTNAICYTHTNEDATFGLESDWVHLDFKHPEFFKIIDDYLHDLSKINIDNL